MEKKLSLSQQIAEIGAGLKFEDLPERVVNNSKMFIMDLLGNIIASRHVDSSLTCLKAVRELGDGDPVSTAIGCNYKTTPQMAALINGTFGHAFDMDDDHRYGTQHSSVVVFPAILALAEKYGCSGKDVLTAFAYGSEITIRLARPSRARPIIRASIPPAPAACSAPPAVLPSCWGWTPRKSPTHWVLPAVRPPVCWSGKHRVHGPSAIRPVIPAMCGVISAIMAKNGYTAPTTVWDGQDGFLRAYSYKDIWNEAKVYEEFGKRWEMADTSIKVHACCRFSAPLADAGVDLFNRGVDYKQVDSILARVNKYSIKVLTIPEETKADPKTVVDAQFSLPYAIACGMVKGHENIDDYTYEAIRDPEVLDLAKKVKWVLDPEIEKVYPKYYPCTVEVTMKDGSVITSHTEYPKGDPENPVTWDEAVEKFRFMAGHEMGTYKVQKIIDLCAHLEELPNLNELVDLLY